MKSEEKKREKLTLHRRFYDQTKKRSDADRLAIYDAILGYGFDNKKINYDSLSDIAQVIVANMSIELNKMKNNYQNGCVKKVNFNTHTFGCSDNRSQTQAKTEPNDSPIYNNKYNNINNYNNQPTDQYNHNKAQFYLECCQDQLKNVTEYAESHGILFSRTSIRFNELIERVFAEKTFQINNMEKTSEQILERYLEIFRALENDVIYRLQSIFEIYDTDLLTKTITNTFKYQVALFYNHALDF